VAPPCLVVDEELSGDEPSSRVYTEERLRTAAQGGRLVEPGGRHVALVECGEVVHLFGEPVAHVVPVVVDRVAGVEGDRHGTTSDVDGVVELADLVVDGKLVVKLHQLGDDQCQVILELLSIEAHHFLRLVPKLLLVCEVSVAKRHYSYSLTLISRSTYLLRYLILL